MYVNLQKKACTWSMHGLLYWLLRAASIPTPRRSSYLKLYKSTTHNCHVCIYPPTYPATYWSTCQFGSPRAGYPLSRANRRWYLQRRHICLLFLLPPLPPPSMNHSCYHCQCNQHTHEQYPTNPCWYCSYQCAWALTHHIHSGARGDHSCWWGGVAC